MDAGIVPHGSSEWRAVVELRREVLRLPLGLNFTEEELQAESDQITLAIFLEGKPIACALLVPAGRYAKVRQVAVSPAQQGRGLGRSIMAACEGEAKRLDATKIVLHARETAVPFYLAIGYQTEGEPFEEVTIPHRRMTKDLD